MNDLKAEDSKYNFIQRFSRKANVIFILGGPGSGKGTQCQKIIDYYGSNFVHLSCGDLLRNETAANTPMGNFIENLLKQGRLVPSEILVRLLKKNMYEISISKSGKCVFLIDGFPRNKENIDVWEQLMKNDAFVNYTYYFDCDESVMEERLLKRAKKSNRSDDNPDTIRRRFRIFKEETERLLKDEAEGRIGHVYYLNANRLVHQIFREVRDQIRLNKLNEFSHDVYWQLEIDQKYQHLNTHSSDQEEDEEDLQINASNKNI